MIIRKLKAYYIICAGKGITTLSPGAKICEMSVMGYLRGIHAITIRPTPY